MKKNVNLAAKLNTRKTFGKKAFLETEKVYRV
jgi:hypothetical protein